ncbi:hypothetical protein F5Y16DRAFT_306307 [Xylariaceae sp. FL0255]|nr:hypothetical protein F5Y16DRAFT_306307 [Xylariaceae sp. FL0255]
MKRVWTVALFALTVSLTQAHAPAAGAWCMDATDGRKLASRYADLMGAFTTAKAEALLIEDFSGTSDSTNVFLGKQLGSLTYTSREDFIEEQGQLATAIMNITNVVVSTCDTVVLRWTQQFDIKPVTGISVLVATMQDDWMIEMLWSEFNSLVYLEDIGGNYTS